MAQARASWGSSLCPCSSEGGPPARNQCWAKGSRACRAHQPPLCPEGPLPTPGKHLPSQSSTCWVGQRGGGPTSRTEGAHLLPPPPASFYSSPSSGVAAQTRGEICTPRILRGRHREKICTHTFHYETANSFPANHPLCTHSELGKGVPGGGQEGPRQGLLGSRGKCRGARAVTLHVQNGGASRHSSRAGRAQTLSPLSCRGHPGSRRSLGARLHRWGCCEKTGLAEASMRPPCAESQLQGVLRPPPWTLPQATDRGGERGREEGRGARQVLPSPRVGGHPGTWGSLAWAAAVLFITTEQRDSPRACKGTHVESPLRTSSSPLQGARTSRPQAWPHLPRSWEAPEADSNGSGEEPAPPPQPTSELTWSGCTQCHSWPKGLTKARGCRGGSGPGDRSAVGSCRGSDGPRLNRCAEGSRCMAVKEDATAVGHRQGCQAHSGRAAGPDLCSSKGRA